MKLLSLKWTYNFLKMIMELLCFLLYLTASRIITDKSFPKELYSEIPTIHMYLCQRKNVCLPPKVEFLFS